MHPVGIDDPLTAVAVCHQLIKDIREAGFQIETHNDLEYFSHVKLQARQEPPSPFFDSTVSGLTKDRYMWMRLTDKQNNSLGLQAYRTDYIDTSLYDWALSYIIGLYVRRNEICLPASPAVAPNSIANRIKGRVVYHGEFWVNPQVKNRKIAGWFSRLGMIMAFLKWHPTAIWALSARNMASHGHPNRMGYAYMESGFLRWRWAINEHREEDFLNISEKASIEQMIQDMHIEQESLELKEPALLKVGEYQQVQFL